LWKKIFLKEQGYESETTIYEDNTSAMLLEKNGKESSSKRTRQINIRYPQDSRLQEGESK